MPRAVRFDDYGGVEVLYVVEVARPEPGGGQVLVRVKAAGINPFEAKLRGGLFRDATPISFPAAQGTDFAGIVEEVGPDVTEFAHGDEIFGTTTMRGSQSELALVSQGNALARPEALPWEVAGGLWIIGTTAYAAVAAIGAGPGDLVVVAGAAGGVGGIAAQLARHMGATVIGVASESSHEWLDSRGMIPVTHGGGLAERLKQAAAATGQPLTALIDTVGKGYVALGVALGIAPDRINTVADEQGAREYGAKSEGGRSAANVEVVAEIARLIVVGKIELPIAATYPLDQVRDAYALLEHGHPPGKIVLIP